MREVLSLSGEVGRARAHSKRLRTAAAAALTAAENAARDIPGTYFYITLPEPSYKAQGTPRKAMFPCLANNFKEFCDEITKIIGLSACRVTQNSRVPYYVSYDTNKKNTRSLVQKPKNRW